MPNKRITEYSELSLPQLDDLVEVVEPFGSPSAENYKLTLARLFGMPGIIPGGRLTLTTAIPVTTEDVTAATSVFYTPYVHDNIQLYDGTRWVAVKFSEVSIALGTLASATIPNDIFGVLSGTDLTLEKLAWTSTSARATDLAYQDGRLVKSGDATRLYLGTFIPTSTTTTEDSEANRYLWSYYNRVQKRGGKTDATSHTLQNVTSREWRATTDSRVNFCVGVVEEYVTGAVRSRFSASAANPFVTIGPGLNSGATTLSTNFWTPGASNGASYAQMVVGFGVPALGANFMCSTEAEGNNILATLASTTTYLMANF